MRGLRSRLIYATEKTPQRNKPGEELYGPRCTFPISALIKQGDRFAAGIEKIMSLPLQEVL